MTTDTQPRAPTDAELMDLGHECELDAIAYGRAVLARWGQAAPAAVAGPARQALIDVIAQGLSDTWHCLRVWSAWNVGTMSQDDFAPVDESDTPAELADAVLALLAAAPATQPAPQQEAQEPCQTCIALARTVMLDQVSFDRKPDCYGIRQITDDEGVEEWEDIRTSPDVAREEANDMMATGRGEIYEVVPLWTTPQPTQAQAGAVESAEFGQFLSDVLTAAGLVTHGKQCKALGERLADMCVKLRHHGIKGGQHGADT